MAKLERSLRATVCGQVQGLGFRPWVYRLAKQFGVRGTVGNSTRGVEILAQGSRAREFLARLEAEPPPLSRITGFAVAVRRMPSVEGFSIVGSLGRAALSVDVLPDIATCPDCLGEVSDPADRRHGYPFTNCTRCGPRYTIIEDLPYDRPRTTMRRFRICPDCQREYEDPGNRRFHAQPNACPVCGPQLVLLDRAGRPVAGDPLELAARAIADGRVVAIKSLGGYQLACDATDARVIRRLRRRKNRPDKPLALMCRDVRTVTGFCRVSRASVALLVSPAAPIVLLPRRAGARLAVPGLVAPRNRRLGVMLAYTPLHRLLLDAFERLSGRPAVLVMTSANRREQPIIADRAELYRELAGVFDLCLDHDREIANRCDDSVVMAGDPERAPLVVRRARGYAPQPLILDRVFHVKHPVLALGGELRGSFCLAAGDRAWLSPHIGNLDSASAERFFRETLERYRRWTGVKATRVSCDLHPDYSSTRLAEQLAAEGRIPLVRVQHHYAHALSVMAEHGQRGPVLAVCLDGTGYGTDGAVWGCELLVVRRDRSWLRVGHLSELELVEAGAVLADPARVAAAYLSQVLGRIPAGLKLGRAARSYRARIGSGQPTRTSSLGRLFDAAAAITGACRTASFEGQAPTALESLADPAERGRWPLATAIGPDGTSLLRADALIVGAAEGILAGEDPARVAAKFQNTVVAGLAEIAAGACAEHGLREVVLSGGSIANTVLRNGLSRLLRREGLTVRRNELVPANDAGLCLGQAVAAGC